MPLIDTLRFMNRLREGGFDEERARTLTETIAEEIQGQVATKADLIELRSELRSDIESLRVDLTTKLADFDARMTQGLSDFDSRDGGRYQDLHRELRFRSDKVSEDITGTKTRLTEVEGILRQEIVRVEMRLMKWLLAMAGVGGLIGSLIGSLTRWIGG